MSESLGDKSALKDGIKDAFREATAAKSATKESITAQNDNKDAKSDNNENIESESSDNTENNDEEQKQVFISLAEFLFFILEDFLGKFIVINTLYLLIFILFTVCVF